MAASRYSFEWPSEALIDDVKKEVAALARCCRDDVLVVISPYRVCPLGAHIDHQGGLVTAMALDKGMLLGFISSDGNEVVLKSRQFGGNVQFRLDGDLIKGCLATSKEEAKHLEDGTWGDYALGAVYALKKRGYIINKGIYGFVDGLKGLHSAGISSSAAVGISFLLALEHANGLQLSAEENVYLDRSIENDFLGLKNGILDQSAILLSRRSCLTVINCKDEKHELIHPRNHLDANEGGYKVLLAFSGLRHALSSNSSYNSRVAECQEAASMLLKAVGRDSSQPLLCNVTIEEYQALKVQLEGVLARRAEHFFTECERVHKGIRAWESCDLEAFGRLMSESGRSSIDNYECGCEPMIELLDIMRSTPGVFGARFSGAGFRGCCVALVDANLAEAAAAHIEVCYKHAQPLLAKQLESGFTVLLCETADHARIC
ncbi:hypothetical protein GOP47_0011165 [Adiantum capillus-veneris]|uniref:Galactokinase n=1 Tax=Adiantum capillus-veneris TaxID=13818 RepID=A0A9D4UTD7_ADICA|nr:hypothetical protein GOP47_0011165 [Adiantum capillus-veneris]